MLNNLCQFTQWFNAYNSLVHIYLASVFGRKCEDHWFFICQKHSGTDLEFTFIPESKTWSEAKEYCKNNYDDLATLTSASMEAAVGEQDFPIWTGLRRDGKDKFQPVMLWKIILMLSKSLTGTTGSCLIWLNAGLISSVTPQSRDVQTLWLWLSWQPSLCRPWLMLPFRGRGKNDIIWFHISTWFSL